MSAGHGDTLDVKGYYDSLARIGERDKPDKRDKNSFEAVEIRAVANGYMVARAPSRTNPGVFSEQPYVFQTIYQLTQWLEDNLVRSDEKPITPSCELTYDEQADKLLKAALDRPDKACAPNCPVCYPQTVGGVQGIGAFNRNS